jgi:hypothetical protein
MKKFITKTVIFVLLLSLPFLLGFFLPTTPRASASLLFGAIQKDSLLANVDSPRIIFIGGSNLSFGLNSQMIKDSLNVNPVNTGIMANLGFKYMANNVLRYIKKGDIIIAALEYEHYTLRYDRVTGESLRMTMDVNRENIRISSFREALDVLSAMPSYSFSKFSPFEYIVFNENKRNVIYSVHSFNEYGDTDVHWGMDVRGFSPYAVGKVNQRTMDRIQEFEQNAERKGAVLYISYPGFNEKSFRASEDRITVIQNELKKRNFKILGTPARYMMPDSLMFDTPYHLNKKGVDTRTKRLIEDIENAKILQ